MKKERFIYNYDYLNRVIEDYLKYYDLKLDDLALRIGMTKRTLKRTLNNERDFYLNEMINLINELRIKDADITQAFFTRVNNPISSESKK